MVMGANDNKVTTEDQNVCLCEGPYALMKTIHNITKSFEEETGTQISLFLYSTGY